MIPRLALFAGLLFVVPMAFVACGDDVSDAGDNNNGIITAPPNDTAETSTPANSTTPGGGATGTEVSKLEIAADDIEFSKDELTAEANAKVELKFTNKEALPHDVAFYRSEKAEKKIYVGDIITGPNKTVTYTFKAPDAGHYFFRCNVHPTQMTGEFTVSNA